MVLSENLKWSVCLYLVTITCIAYKFHILSQQSTKFCHFFVAIHKFWPEKSLNSINHKHPEIVYLLWSAWKLYKYPLVLEAGFVSKNLHSPFKMNRFCLEWFYSFAMFQPSYCGGERSVGIIEEDGVSRPSTSAFFGSDFLNFRERYLRSLLGGNLPSRIYKFGIIYYSNIIYIRIIYIFGIIYIRST